MVRLMAVINIRMRVKKTMLAVSWLLIISCKVINKHHDEQTFSQIQIDFQDHFIEDTVSIKINNNIFIEAVACGFKHYLDWYRNKGIF